MRASDKIKECLNRSFMTEYLTDLAFASGVNPNKADIAKCNNAPLGEKTPKDTGQLRVEP